MNDKSAATADDIAKSIADGSKVAMFKDGGVPMEIGRALVRRGARGLHVVTVPTGGMLPDLLIGAGCVSTIETAGVSMGEHGPASCFARAVKSGQVNILDATCPAVYAGLQAAQKGIPFMPMRGLIGSDILAQRPDFIVIDNPHGSDDPIVTLPAIQPDIAIMHVPLADRFGNVWIGRQSELRIMAQAAKQTFATAEKIVDDNILENEQLSPGAIPAFYITALAVARNGAWPMNLPGRYVADADEIRRYCLAAGTPEGFQRYVDANILADPMAAE